MDVQNLLGSSLTKAEREVLETIADQLEVAARLSFNNDAFVLDKGNNEVSIRNYVAGIAWDFKQIARYGTNSYGI